MIIITEILLKVALNTITLILWLELDLQYSNKDTIYKTDEQYRLVWTTLVVKTVIVVWGVISRLEQVVFGSEYDNVSFALEKHAWLFIVLDHWNNSPQKDVASFWHIILILSQPVLFVCKKSDRLVHWFQWSNVFEYVVIPKYLIDWLIGV
jgi:hypothetical protein